MRITRASELEVPAFGFLADGCPMIGGRRGEVRAVVVSALTTPLDQRISSSGAGRRRHRSAQGQEDAAVLLHRSAHQIVGRALLPAT